MVANAVQPYLIAVQGNLQNQILKYFLALDSRAMELGRIPAVRAVDWLFKACVVFNVHYPSTWNMFFRLLQTCCYEVFFTDEDDAPPSAVEIFNLLQG